MTITEALELVISRTGVERYRYLCLEHPKPNVRAEYSAHVIRLAAQRSSPDPKVAEVAAIARKVQDCPFRSVDSGGCRCARCALRGGAGVSNLECIQCIRNYL